MKNIIKPVYLLMGATIVLILVKSIFFLNQFSYNQTSYNTAKKAYKTIEYANLLQSTLLNAQAGQSSYYITSDSTFLASFYLDQQKLKNICNALYTYRNDDKLQSKKIKELNVFVNLKLAIFTKSIQYQQEGKTQKAYELFTGNQSKSLSKRISVLITQIKSSETKLLQHTNKSIDRLNLRIKLFSIISNWILLVIIVSALIIIIRNRQKIQTLFDQVGKKNELLKTRTDELQNMSACLMGQNAELERFAYVASHDLRSPAMNQIALLDLYVLAKTDEERALLFRYMKEAATNLSVKLDDLIEALRSRHGSNQLYEELKFETVYKSVAANLTADIVESKAQISCDFSQATDIFFPKSYLESIMQNLLSNAIKYRHPQRRPEIKITTHKANARTCFTIKDNGLGIDLDKDGKKLFGLYKTFHKGHNSKGLGLYITKAQIMAMGGTIDVESIPDVGTAFTVCV